MKYLSLFSGIEAASVAWRPMGWECVAVAEIEPFPCAVLAHHYPDAPNFGDVSKHKEWPHADVDVLVGGSPCQAFSVAGLRKGLDDPRGNLTLTYLAVVDQYRPKWVVWENVPGVLSIDGGRTFGAFLGGLAQLGYGFAYRVLDAQHFGVPQRRRRVFVVGCLGDWRSAAAVLFERHSLQGHPAPRRETGQVAPTIPSRSLGGGGLGTDFDCDGGLIPAIVGQAMSAKCAAVSSGHGYWLDAEDKAATLRAQDSITKADTLIVPVAKCLRTTEGNSRDAETTTLLPMRGEGFDASEDGTGRGTPLVPVTAPCLTSNYVAAMRVRRLTPRECERLQGFPDDYTLIQVRNKPAADGPRYKALGNSMAVPVMAWLGQRIQQAENISLDEAA